MNLGPSVAGCDHSFTISPLGLMANKWGESKLGFCGVALKYAIATWLEARSNGTLGIDDSALYQALQRMEGRGWLSAEWGTSENNRRARYYKLTTAGRQRLRTESDTWLRYTRSVTSILALASRTA